jgi:DNA-binding MarR family transcriptional regulator
MSADFLRELEFLGVTARLKRLSDGLSTSIRELYRVRGVDLEPGWHLVLLYLEGRTATPSEIAASLKLSQPAVTKTINRMVLRGYLDVRPEDADARKKNVRLSAKARDRMPDFARIWDAGQLAVRDILGRDTAFLRQLEVFEDGVGRRGFSERALEHLDTD